MVVPKPPVKLEHHCSVIHDNTLYTYSSNGFASIPLGRNGTWSEMTPGVPVSDAVCVTGAVDGNEDQQALYVVGGISTTSDKPGLQRYSFKDKKWKTLISTGSEISNRTSHGAVYLKSISSILVYGGHRQDGSIATSDTFILDTAAPYGILSRTGENAFPAVSPVLLPWNDQQAALIGGVLSTGVYLWDSSRGWHYAAGPLNKELPDGSETAVLRGSDGSHLLQTFDMSVSPSTVTSTRVMPQENKAQSAEKTKLDSFDSYPDYDDTLAPSAIRQDYSLAQSDDSLVVISSGSGTDALAIFNQTSNSWVNATKLFYGDMSEQEILASTTSSETTSSTTPTASASSDSSSSDSDGGSDTRTIIGATLGSLLGVAALLILILLFLRRKRQQREKAQQGSNGDRDRLSFQDQGVEPLTRSAYPMAQSPAPLAASSVDSLAIFSGGMGDEKSPKSALPAYMQKSHPAKPSPLTNIQSSSDYSTNDKAFEAQYASDGRTEEGWGKYFQNNSTPTLVGGVQAQTPAATDRGSKATVWPLRSPLPRLNMSFLEEPQPLGRVNTGSPTTEHVTSLRDGRQIAIPESQSARISSASSISNHSDFDDDYHHDRGEYGYTSPAQTQSWIGRPPSSTYSRSFFNNPNTPGQSQSPAPPTTTDYRKHDSTRTTTRASSILIADDQQPQPHPPPGNNINSDMSWLNLQADR